MMIEQSDSNSTPAEASVQLLGEFLREKRLAKNFTLEKISQKTKINLNILRSIEANDYQNLPSAAYIKGFVTSYSKTLGLEQNEVHSKMEYTYYRVLGKAFPNLNHTTHFKNQDATGSAEKETVESPHKIIENSKNVLESTKSFLPIAIFAGVVVAIIGGYQLVSSVIKNEIESTKQQDLGPTFEPSSALLKEKPQVPKVEELKTEATTATTSTEETPVATAATTEEKKEGLVETVQTQERNFPNVEFRKVRSRLFTLVSDAAENGDENLLPETIRKSMNPEMQNIYIKAVDGNTWLSYKVDERPIESVIIEKDRDLFIQGSEIRIFLGNVRVTKIFYNNGLIDANSKSGVKSLIFPESSNAKYMLPLFPKAKDDILYTNEEYMKRMKLEEDQLNKKVE
ncbi:MAG: helix-turn-helix domain-containing protein [Bacteriovoracaceae bacterium]